MRVSIGMPVYNAAAFLRPAIDSILAQTFTDFELVISDNASTDETELICADYAARDPRVRYERLEDNQGAIRNFNRLVGISRGEYFKWAAGDDICAPTMLEELVAVLDHRPEVLWSHCISAKIDHTGRCLSIDEPAAEGLAITTQDGLPRQDHDSPLRHRRYRGVLLGSTWCADAYGLFRRNVLLKTGLMPEVYGGEKVLIGELALNGLYHEVEKVLFFQRVHGNTAGQIQSEAEQVAYMLARPAKAFHLTRLVLLNAHLRAVCRVPMPISDRVRCLGVIGEYLFQFEKWLGIVRSTVFGKAVGRERVRPTANTVNPRQGKTVSMESSSEEST